MICPQCGSENALDALFCMRCGTALSLQAESSAHAQSGWGQATAGSPTQAPPGMQVDPATGLWVQAGVLPEGQLAYAEWWRRLVIWILDGFINAFGAIILASIFFLLGAAFDPDGVERLIRDWFEAEAATDIGEQTDYSGLQPPAVVTMVVWGVGFLIVIVSLALYEILFTKSERFQGTLGKVIMSARVADVHGNRIGGGRATGRYFAKWIYNLSYCGYLFDIISAITIAAHERRQGLHDMMAGTVVLRKDAPLPPWGHVPGAAPPAPPAAPSGDPGGPPPPAPPMPGPPA